MAYGTEHPRSQPGTPVRIGRGRSCRRFRHLVSPRVLGGPGPAQGGSLGRHGCAPAARIHAEGSLRLAQAPAAMPRGTVTIRRGAAIRAGTAPASSLPGLPNLRSSLPAGTPIGTARPRFTAPAQSPRRAAPSGAPPGSASSPLPGPRRSSPAPPDPLPRTPRLAPLGAPADA